MFYASIYTKELWCELKQASQLQQIPKYKYSIRGAALQSCLKTIIILKIELAIWFITSLQEPLKILFTFHDGNYFW